MLKLVVIIIIMIILFALSCAGSPDYKITKAVICCGLATALAFGGQYIVNMVETSELDSHKHTIALTEKENIVDATCTEAGSYDEVSYCDCGEELSREAFTTEPLEHDYAAVITSASCDESGFTTYTCSRCGDTYEDDYTDALGHDFINGVCSRCSYADLVDGAQDGEEQTFQSDETLDGAVYAAQNVDFITYSGTINNDDQTDTYELVAPVSGYYRFDLSNMVNGFTVKAYVYDSDGNEMGGSYSLENGEGVTCKLEQGINYTLHIMSNMNTGNYTLSIGQAKESVNITDYGVVNDSVEYKEQQNEYVFIPSVSGIYRFEFSEIVSGFNLELYVYDSLNYKVDGGYGLGNREGITVELTAGESYTIEITQCNAVGSYIMSIGKPNPTLDITGKTKTSGNIIYTNQQNIYTYIPSETKQYLIFLQNMISGFRVSLVVRDSLGYKVVEDYGLENNGEIKVELTGGETYTIYLVQCDSFGDYVMNISSQEL